MNNVAPSKRYINVWLDFDQVTKLEDIAKQNKVDVAAVVQEIITPVLEGDEEHECGRFILLRISTTTYRHYLKFFENDADMAKQSMVASVEIDGESFARAMRE